MNRFLSDPGTACFWCKLCISEKLFPDVFHYLPRMNRFLSDPGTACFWCKLFVSEKSFPGELLYIIPPFFLGNYILAGCYTDNSNRAIPDTGITFSGSSAIEDCAYIANSNGYRAFGVQNGGECYTGPRAHETYDVHGKAPASECSNGLGGVWRNDVYLIGRLDTLRLCESRYTVNSKGLN